MVTSLTSFRFITAFIVFLFHCQIHLGWKVNIKIIDKFIAHGAVFMSGFFVLSGFIMTYVYNNTDFTKQKNVFNFYLKRFARIYPTYAVTTIVYFIIFHTFSAQQYIRIIVNDLFVLQGFFSSMFPIGINGGTWSLTVEMFLYFLFPLLTMLSCRSPKILIFAVIFAVIISLNVVLEKTDYLYANPIVRVPDFICGMGFYFISHKFKNIKTSHYIHIVVIALLFLTIVFLGTSNHAYLQGQFVILPLFGAWITIVFFSKSKFYNNKVLEYFGLISYSFYLWQFVAISAGKELITIYPNINLSLAVLIVFFINLFISILSYHFLENPARKFIITKYSY